MTQTDQELSQEEEKVLQSVKGSRIILPIIIGLGVVGYLIWSQWDAEAFEQITWGFNTIFWLLMAVVCYLIRHVIYAWRLRILSLKAFTWKKCMELIVLWEFSSSVSPTSVGGSAVALFFLAQEKISSARAVSIVMYSLVVDTLYFILTLPLLFMIFGPVVLRPDATSFGDLGAIGITFVGLIAFMIIYGLIFFYGLFINPVHIQRFLLWLADIKLLKRFSKNLSETAMGVVEASDDLKTKSWKFHMSALVSTFGAWVTRFLGLYFIIIALVSGIPESVYSHIMLFGRGEMMHSMIQFYPTPGGAGLTEITFGGFYSDFIPIGIAFVVALVWRLITYYPYLIAGAIVIPNWLRGIINNRRRERLVNEK